jgi:hypothetical protein
VLRTQQLLGVAERVLGVPSLVPRHLRVTAVRDEGGQVGGLQRPQQQTFGS